MDLAQPSDESKVLILNTGGTINMILSQHGYVPEPYFLTETLRTQNRFHDPLEDSLFSHSASVEGYREWSSHSGKASPIPKPGAIRAASPDPVPRPQHSLPTLLVRSSRPIGMSHVAAQLSPVIDGRQPTCIKVADDLYEAQLPSLITPRSTAPGGIRKRIRYAVLEVSVWVSYMREFFLK